MNASKRTLPAWIAVLIGCLCLGSTSIASAQISGTAKPSPADAKKSAAEAQRERAITRCRENRGVDCDTAAGLKEWIDQERPMTAEQRRAAIAAANARRNAGK